MKPEIVCHELCSFSKSRCTNRQQVEGLTAVITETIGRLMTSISDKNSSEFSSYAITIGKTGGIGRIDCYMFYYKFASPHLDRILQNCLVSSFIVSMVEPSKLCLDNLQFLSKAAYSSPLPGESERDADLRLENIKRMLVEVTQAAIGGKLRRPASA